MVSTSKLLPILVLLSLFSLPLLISNVGAPNGDTAALAISQAEETVASAYEAVLEAERVGANVSGLLDELNVAGEYLADAHMLYRLGNLDGAVYAADLSSEIGVGVKNEAEELRIDAYGSWITSLLIRITGSIVGVFVVVLGTLMGWRIFKRRYFGQA